MSGGPGLSGEWRGCWDVWGGGLEGFVERLRSEMKGPEGRVRDPEKAEVTSYIRGKGSAAEG